VEQMLHLWRIPKLSESSFVLGNILAKGFGTENGLGIFMTDQRSENKFVKCIYEESESLKSIIYLLLGCS